MKYNQYLFQQQRDALLSVQNTAICMGCAMFKIPRLKVPPSAHLGVICHIKLKFRWKESFSPLQWRFCSESSWSVCKCSAFSSQPHRAFIFKYNAGDTTFSNVTEYCSMQNPKNLTLSPNFVPFNPLPFERAVFPSRLLKPSVLANSSITELNGLWWMELRAVHCSQPHLQSLFEIAWAQKLQNKITRGLRRF